MAALTPSDLISNLVDPEQKKTLQELAQPVDEDVELFEAEDAYEHKKRVEVSAYYLWLKRRQYGRPGDALSDWLEAEKENQ